LIVTKPQTPIPDLFSQNAIFFHQIFDNLLLMAVHPAGDRVTTNENGSRDVVIGGYYGRISMRTSTQSSQRDRILEHYGVRIQRCS